MRKGDIHAKAGADFNQQRHEQREPRLHHFDIEARQLGEHARLWIGFCQRRPARRLGQPPADLGDAGLKLLGFLRRGQLRGEFMELLTEVAIGPARHVGAAGRIGPGPLALETVEITLHRVGRAMLGNPTQLFLRAFGVGAQIGVSGGFDGTLATGVEAVERRMAERRGHGIAGDDRPYQGCRQGL